jgi:D-alanyl-D-alanine dipeptidase
MKKTFNLFLWYLAFSIANTSLAAELPKDFVYLKDIEPTIIENLRYFSNENFMGRKIDGYKANRVILTSEAAIALVKIQQELLKNGYSLVIYDAYRPQLAVDFFMKWSKDSNDQVAKEKYYPDINKADVFKLGYVAEKSGHSRGSTVDLSIIRIGDSLKPITFQKRQLKNGSIIPFLDDGSVDMSSSFDLFGEASHHDSNLIETEFLARRNYLRGIMKKNGFNDYPEEWWHYTLKNEPFPDTYFDFVVE